MGTTAFDIQASHRDLLAAAQAQGVRRAQLHERVVRRHLPLAHGIAHRFAGRGVALDDLRQVAAMGLVQAVHGFDPRRGDQFLGYAVPTIKGELRRHFRDLGWTVRPPRRIQELQASLAAIEPGLTQRLGRTPSETDLAEAASASVTDVRESFAAEGCFTPQSIDLPRFGGSGTLADELGADDAELARIDTRLALAGALSGLCRRDRQIIALRFGEELTQDEIGRRIGVTQMQVSRLLTRILGDLREQLADAA